MRDVRLGHFTEVEFSPEDLEINRWWLRTDPPAVVWQTQCGTREMVDQHGHWYHEFGEAASHLVPDDSPVDLGEHAEWFWVDALVAVYGGTAPVPDATPGTSGLCTYEWSGIVECFRCKGWVTYDPVTRRIYGCGLMQDNLNSGKPAVRIVRAHYTYDDPMQTNAFEFPAAIDSPEPSDSPEPINDPWGLAALITTVEEGERTEVSARVQHLLRAWLSGSAEEFLEDWYFLPESLHEGLLPARAVWEQRVATQAAVCQGWEPQVGEPVKRNRVCLPLTVGTFRPLPIPGAMEVEVTWRPPPAAGSVEEVYSEVFLLAHEGRLRVVHWNLPWPQDPPPHDGEVP